jgi:hypothetical protein
MPVTGQPSGGSSGEFSPSWFEARVSYGGLIGQSGEELAPKRQNVDVIRYLPRQWKHYIGPCPASVSRR